MNKLGIFMNFWEKNWDADHAKYIRKAKEIGFDAIEVTTINGTPEEQKSTAESIRMRLIFVLRMWIGSATTRRRFFCVGSILVVSDGV